VWWPQSLNAPAFLVNQHKYIARVDRSAGISDQFGQLRRSIDIA